MRRIDALGEMRDDRLGVLTGDVLDESLDDALQSLVWQAAQELAVPIALVSIVLRHTQFFRAHVGLPADLAALRATDRDASFCQFVVRDGARFEVTRASTDPRVPQELAARYGIEAYLGEPVKVAGMVVGSLCVMGTEPKTFTDEERSSLERLAARVSERLDELALRSRATSRRMIAQAAAPAFDEVRNILTALTNNTRSARIAAVEARPVVQLLRAPPEGGATSAPAPAWLSEAAHAVEAWVELSARIDDSAGRLLTTFAALEGLVLARRGSVPLAEVIDLASRLAHHSTKLVGGVSWAPGPSGVVVRAPRMVAVSVLSSALGILADAMGASQAGIRGAVRTEPGAVVLELCAEALGRESLDGCLARLTALVDKDPHAVVTGAPGGGLAIHLSAGPHAPAESA